MAKSNSRAYSRYTQEASALLGMLIKSARTESKLTAQEVADRVGISRGLLRRIEKGNLNCAIGSVFEVATIVGLNLFDLDNHALSRQLSRIEQKLTLLPKSVRKKTKVVHDDF